MAPLLLDVLVHINDLGASQEVRGHARRDDRGDARLHQSVQIGGQDDPHPVEAVCLLVVHDAIQRDLAADEEEERETAVPSPSREKVSSAQVHWPLV